MKLLEYEAKEYFRKYGIPTPEGVMVTDSDTAVEAAKKLGKPVVIKAQLPVGGRGKAGGIKFAENPLEAGEVAAELLGKEIKGLKVEKLYVEEKLDIKDELYLGITVDRNNNRYVVLASKEGGVEIEEVASKTPEKIIRHQIDPIMGLRSFHANHIGQELGYSSKMMRAFASFVTKLYTLAREMDAELTEINPLIELEDGFLAADARLNVDNNALFRHKELEEKLLDSYQGELTERELDARKKGLTYVELDGNIGIIGNGAGLTMATLDTVMLKGGKAANFLDLGGGATPERIEEAAKFILSDERTEALLINVLGGITRCDHIAEGLVNARTEVAVEKPIVVRMMGTKEEEGREILRNAGIDMLDTMETASEKAVQIVEEN
jgi:succinyl-CoA synthetase beta subunit